MQFSEATARAAGLRIVRVTRYQVTTSHVLVRRTRVRGHKAGRSVYRTVRHRMPYTVTVRDDRLNPATRRARRRALSGAPGNQIRRTRLGHLRLSLRRRLRVRPASAHRRRRASPTAHRSRNVFRRQSRPQRRALRGAPARNAARLFAHLLVPYQTRRAVAGVCIKTTRRLSANWPKIIRIRSIRSAAPSIA